MIAHCNVLLAVSQVRICVKDASDPSVIVRNAVRGVTKRIYLFFHDNLGLMFIVGLFFARAIRS